MNILYNLHLHRTTQREVLKASSLYYLTTSNLLLFLTAILGLRTRTSMMEFTKILSTPMVTASSESFVEIQKSSILSQKSMILGTQKILYFVKARMHRCFQFQQQPLPFMTCLALLSRLRTRSPLTL